MSQQAKVKKNQWASDEAADDLLADIFSDTATAAAMEEQRLEAEIKRREQQEEQRRHEEEQRRLQEAEAKLRDEQQRQNQLEQRRTARMEAIKVEDLKAKGEWVDPAIEEAKRKAEEERRIREEAARQAEILAEQRLAAQQARDAQAPVVAPAQVAPAKSNRGAFIALGAAAVAVLGAGAVIAAMTLGAYQLDPAPYAKITLEPKPTKDMLTVKGFTPLPKEEPVVVAQKEDDKKRPARSGKSKSSPKSDDKAKPGKKPGLKLDLDGPGGKFPF